MDYSIETNIVVYYQFLKEFNIVNDISQKAMKKSLLLFYNLFNDYSGNLNKLKTETFRILLRRAIIVCSPGIRRLSVYKSNLCQLWTENRHILL